MRLTFWHIAAVLLLPIGLTAQPPSSDEQSFQQFLEWLSTRPPTSRPTDLVPPYRQELIKTRSLRPRGRSPTSEVVATSIQGSGRVAHPVEQTLRRKGRTYFRFTSECPSGADNRWRPSRKGTGCRYGTRKERGFPGYAEMECYRV